MFSAKKYTLFRWLHLPVAAGMFFLFSAPSAAQFPPPAGQPGSTAIKADSAIFVQWALSCTVERGYVDISDTTLGFVNYGADISATGMADADVVSLGDGGSAVLFFEVPISNGPGYDFAVFENSFSDDFLELAFVEVSSDGNNFFRFFSVSNTQTEEQIETFGALDATKIHNLAGKYRGGYGTPFDLEELKNSEGLDVTHIIAVRVTDVVGSIDPAYARFDGQGNIINDPWPTPFESSGFDLDAIGVIHDINQLDVATIPDEVMTVNPNPARDVTVVAGLKPGDELRIFDPTGQEVYRAIIKQGPAEKILLGNFSKGLLIARIRSGNTVRILKVVHI